MKMNDWITYTVELYPKTRKLGELLNRREYDEAYMVAANVQNDLNKLRAYLDTLMISLKDN